MREHRRFFLGTILAGLALRLFFFLYFPAVTDDSRIYADLATNLLQHGVYGQTQGTQIVPTDTRLPGYPLFLAKIFFVFGAGNFKAVLLAQILFDLVTCLVIADLARRVISERAARAAFALAALCPFLANYAAAVLTETLEIFFTAVALDCAAAALERVEQRAARVIPLFAASGAAIAGCILLRPDGGVLLVAVVLYLSAARRPSAPGRRLLAVAVLAGCALAPLAPWTVRNFRTLHHFQPLAPRYANESDELVPRGFIRWVKTWIVDYASVEEIYWNVPGDKIDPDKLPTRAFDNSAERESTLAAIGDYNATQLIEPSVDARFGGLAAERIRAHPSRYYVELPILRAADMWLRPRTELLPPDVRWWEFNDDPKYSALVVGFGMLNLLYLAAAAWALAQRRSAIRWVGLFVTFVVLRSALLLILENPEPRYTLECFPAVILMAAALASNKKIA